MARARTRQPEAPPQRRRWVVLMLAAMIVVAASAIAQTWTNLRAIDYGYQISKATRQRAKLQQANRRLRIELALLKRPERIAGLAASAGLKPPEPAQVRRLELPPAPPPEEPSAPDPEPEGPKSQPEDRPVVLSARPATKPME